MALLTALFALAGQTIFTAEASAITAGSPTSSSNVAFFVHLLNLDVDTTQLVRDSVALTPEQKREIQSYINSIRAAGRTQEADRLQQALDAGKIRMGDPSQMNGIAMVTSMSGYVIINEAIYEREQSTHGGSHVLRSQLLHEGVHLRQFDLLEMMEAQRPGGEYNPNRMEVDAYSIQIAYLRERYNESQDPAVRALLAKVIKRLEDLRADAESKSDNLTKLKPGAFKDPRPMLKNDKSESISKFEGLSGLTRYYTPRISTNDSLPYFDEVAYHRELVQNGPWAGMDDLLPLSVTDLIVQAAGVVPDYNLKTWSNAQYASALGGLYDTTLAGSIATAKTFDFTVRTNPSVIGKTLDQIALGVPLFLVESVVPNRPTYGYDKEGNFIKLPPAP